MFLAIGVTILFMLGFAAGYVWRSIRVRRAMMGYWSELGLRAQDHAVTPEEHVAVFNRWLE